MVSKMSVSKPKGVGSTSRAAASPQSKPLPLYRVMGNRSFGLLLKGLSPARIQAKPQEVSEPSDPEEKEADRVSDEVSKKTETVRFTHGDDDAQSHHATPRVQEPGTRDTIERTAVHGGLLDAGPDIGERIGSRIGQGIPLSSDMLGQMESAFGADFRDVRIHTDHHAAGLSQELNAKAFTSSREIFFGAGKFAPGSADGRRLLAHELTHVIQQDRSRGSIVQRQGKDETAKVGITFTVTVNEQITGTEFFIRAVMQYAQLSRPDALKKIEDHKFTIDHPVFKTGVTSDLVGKPIHILVLTGGLTKGDKASLAKRTASIDALPQEKKNGINDETDRRFWARYEYKRGKKLGFTPKEEGMRQAWLRTRESVIQDQETIDKLPSNIKQFLSPGGLRPEDYRAILRIAGKLKTFSATDWELYKRRVTAKTDDYEKLEQAINLFQAQQASEKNTMDRINGKEALYQKVKSFKKLEQRMLTPPMKSDRLPIDQPGNRERFDAETASLNAALKEAGFASIADFDAACDALIALFRKRAVELTLLALRGSEKIVLEERKRYDDPAQNADLFARLAPLRTAVDESEKAFQQALPTPMQLKSETMSQTKGQQDATARYDQSTKKASAERKQNEKQNPILQDPKLSNAALNAKTADELGRVLRNNADDRLGDIRRTRVNVLDDGDMIFKLDPIFTLTRQELQVAPNSIFDLKLKDYQSDLTARELIIGLAIGALALGLGLLSFGGGTVAVLAGAAGLGLGIYSAASEIDKYSDAKAAAHTSFDKALSVSQEDPSALWVALALIGVGLDGAGLVAAFKAAGPAARVLKETRDLAKFEAELAKATELSAAVRKSLARASASEKEFLNAAEELGVARKAAKGRLHSGPDPDVLVKATKAAYYAIKDGITDVEVFLRKLRLSKFAKGIDFENLTAQEFQAFEKAFKAGGEQLAAEAGKVAQGIKVPFKSGNRLLTFDESGKMLLDGKPVNLAEHAEVYEKLGITHVVKGHGPDKPIAEVINEARVVDATHPGLSSKFNSDPQLFDAIERATAARKPKETLVHIDALPNAGRAFARADKVPAGVQPLLPFEGVKDVVELPVKRIRAVFEANGKLKSIFPIAE